MEELGYKLTLRHDGSYPSESWEKVLSHGHWVQELVFDTIHGGPWTFEMFLHTFVYNEELNWTTQERIEFNPASRDFIGSNVGHWQRDIPCLTADECMAVAEHISNLERIRKQAKVVDE